MQEILHSLSEQLQTIPSEQPQPEPAMETDTLSSTPCLEMEGMVRDEITKLVQSLFLFPEVKRPRRVVFAGTESGSGCTWICAHAAEVLASQIRASVCVVDCNLRSPRLHQQLGLENHHGLSLGICNDAIVLGGLSDGVVLVLKANSSRREKARQALQDLRAANIPIFGAILNQRTFPIPDRIYRRL